MKALGHAAEHLAQPGRLRGRKPQRPAHPLRVQPEQRPGRDCRPEHPGAPRDVPSHRIVRWQHRLSDPARRIDAQHRGPQQRLAGRLTPLGQCRRCRQDGSARMDQRRLVRIVEVEHMRGNAVQERGRQRVRPLSAPKQRGLRRASERPDRVPRSHDRRVPRAADGATHEVDQRPLRLAPHRVRQRSCARAGIELRQTPCRPQLLPIVIHASSSPPFPSSPEPRCWQRSRLAAFAERA